METQSRQSRENRQDLRPAEKQTQADPGRGTARPLERLNTQALGRTALHSGEAVFELPPLQLEELASAVGNMAMTELLSDGDEGPCLCPFDGAIAAGEETEANPIHTSPPRLCRAAGFGNRDGPPGRAADPRGIRERPAPGKHMDLFGAL